jgi:acetyl-CoA carboxylase biotin carboxylase subunit
MRVVERPADFAAALAGAKREAAASFADDRVLIEKYLTRPRHIEIQVFADAHGNCVYLFERDCSVQRRHQKILEEAPSPALSEAARAELAERAIRAAVAAGYENVGTLEFLVDRDGNTYFIEINCRIQVEHPITEALTGIDLVAMQIGIAAGEPLGLAQSDVTFAGHAIEFRINAEDPEHDFRPSTGLVERYVVPGGPGVRMDSHLYAGYEVPPFYDSMLGKLIVWGPDRGTAIARARGALDELLIEGLVTNVAIHEALLTSQPFLDGEITTNMLDRVGSAAFLSAAARAS